MDQLKVVDRSMFDQVGIIAASDQSLDIRKLLKEILIKLMIISVTITRFEV